MVVVVVAELLGSALCGAAPIPQDQAVSGAEPLQAAAPLTAEPASPPEASRPPARASADRAAEAGRGAAPGTTAPLVANGTEFSLRAKVPERRGAVVPVEENPSVDVLDVARTVLESTLAGAPWIRVGSRRPVERARRVDGGSSEAPPEMASRLDDNGDAERARTAGSATSDDTPRLSAGSHSNPVRDAVQLVRELIGHPIAWVIGVLALLASLALAVVRGYGK